MGKGLHLTGCKAVFCEHCNDTGHIDRFSVPIGCPYCEEGTNYHLKRAGFGHLIEPKPVEPWRLGETHMYQEPEPVDRWPTPTWWEHFRARIKMWYRRLRRRSP
jgi:hypothetical protein